MTALAFSLVTTGTPDQAAAGTAAVDNSSGASMAITFHIILHAIIASRLARG
ncbi:hypothetical protein [Massilia sp.]|uniref:hypothetical protein n=1 Tax=Massilia sp. TaxID=1882437 RepID=UPI00289CBA1C|nr:hypothetical protein [Massilia sp.]